MKKCKMMAWLICFFLFISMSSEFVNASGTNVPDAFTYEETKGNAFTSIADAAEYLKNQMIARNTKITIVFDRSEELVPYWNISSGLNQVVLDKACEHTATSKSNEGDALRYAYYSVHSAMSLGIRYSITYEFTYLSTAEQEEKLQKAMDAALTSLNLKDKTEYEKIKAIYDYIADHVDYDYEHLPLGNAYPTMFSAYGALCEGRAVCQGYAQLFYRMCRAEGLDVRIVSGYGNGIPHAWNIVKISDLYYNADCTWDGQDKDTRHDWFLLSDSLFTEHERDAEYASKEFYEKYPMAETAYDPSVSEVSFGEEFARYGGYVFYTTDAGETVCYDEKGTPVINDFKCDGTYTYYFQADGTAMKDRLTYHPDGIHVIYFDSKGHEVFSDFAHVSRSITNEPVNDYCFFDVHGYMYVDVLTWNKAGDKLLYANAYGRIEQAGWFQFSESVQWANGASCDGIAGGYGYGQSDCTLLRDTFTYDWLGRPCYLQGNGVALY